MKTQLKDNDLEKVCVRKCLEGKSGVMVFYVRLWRRRSEWARVEG